MKKKCKNLIIGVISVFLIVSCSKEINDNLAEVVFTIEFDKTSNIETFLDTSEDLQFSIVSESAINANDYEIKYNVTEGAGSYFIEDSEIIENQFVSLPAGPDYVMGYVGTSIGEHSVTITIRNVDSGREELVVLTYNITDTAFILSASLSSETAYLGEPVDINLNITGLDTDDYSLEYAFVTLDDIDVIGAGTISIDQTTLDQNTAIEVATGDFVWQFEGNTMGTVDILFTATNSFGITVEELFRFEVGDAPLFAFEATSDAVDSNQLSTVPVDIVIDISEAIGTSSSYTMVYSSSKAGNFTYDNVVYEPGDEIPVVIGTSVGKYSASGSGVHEITFTVSNGNASPLSLVSSLTIEFFPPDSQAPFLILGGEGSIVTLNVSEPFIETITARDITDGDLTDQIVIGGDTVNTNVIGTYNITYNVQDSSGNEANQLVRTIKVVDTEAPVIRLNGPDLVILTIGDAYSEEATVSDNSNENITITFGGTFVNTNIAGDFLITYDAVDSSDNEAIQLTRRIIVQPEQGNTASFDKLTGVLIAPLESEIVITMLSVEDNNEEHGAARISIEGSDFFAEIATCFGSLGDCDLSDQDTDPSNESAKITFSSRTINSFVLIGSHTPRFDFSLDTSTTAVVISVDGVEVFNGIMDADNGIPN
ncbi:hypothetical protein GCM10022393_12190 [Aquimarina addita]|uniref:Pesticidal crystal protein Cry22Aa Ig-like domain-containing protein n=1 Tax=Aquimarina addita TaxID=870485 RepID=A0ABP7XE38_9FLAO